MCMYRLLTLLASRDYNLGRKGGCCEGHLCEAASAMPADVPGQRRRQSLLPKQHLASLY